ncbi:MAG: amino acid transporter [Chromatiales bacterium 21-64-14]|nr:MAG: amino acid transporter [Chromatiales bacterium 21-64-14]
MPDLNPDLPVAAPVQSPSVGAWDRIRRRVFGPPRDPTSPDTRRHITLIAFLAWVGLGADGLSSACYGPEEAFKALGNNTALGIYLALATAVTVFVIAVGYNQVIELFPSGGGGYKVASRLLGRYAGLVSGAALVVDYVLTIAISISAAVDALFSFLPTASRELRVASILALLLILTLLNLRGMKESIKILMPVFLGFVVTHAFLIFYGIGLHWHHLGTLYPSSTADVVKLSHSIGLYGVIALFLRAYAMGGGTYTGIEAVSNSVHLLKEPRVTTGKWTMFYMALSLSFIAGGVILLYLLWNAEPVAGKTLNAVVFSTITSHWEWNGWDFGTSFVTLVMMLEAGLLLVAANTGFLAGPMVLANMAVDSWLPRRFSYLSERLVTKNGILLMAVAAFVILLWTDGAVDTLVVLYSMNVFLTFSLSLLGMCVYWWRNRGVEPGWLFRLLLSAVGLFTAAGILIAVVLEKFDEGGWVTAVVTGSLVALCLLIYRHYQRVGQQLNTLDEILTQLPTPAISEIPSTREGEPAAVFFVSRYRGVGMHTLLNVQRLFPGHFHNFLFVSVGEVDSSAMRGGEGVTNLQDRVQENLRKYVDFCHAHGLAAASYASVATEAVEGAVELAREILEKFPGSVFFAGTLVFKNENWLTRLLHNYTAQTLQRRLHLMGANLMIFPMLVDARRGG